MQPPPQTLPPGMAGPPPAGTPRSMFWGSSGYRRPASSSALAAPPCPQQPVTDPFAFSRQVLQNSPLDSSPRSSLPAGHDSALPVFSQWPSLPAPHASPGDGTRGPQEPPPGPLSQPGADPFPAVSIPPSLPGHEMSRIAEVGFSSEPEVLTPLHPTHHIPGGGPDPFHGGHWHGSGTGLEQALSRHTLSEGGVASAAAAAAAASPYLPQPRPQMPAQWGPVQDSPQPSQQHPSPCPEGPVQSMGPQATSTPYFPAPSSLHHGPGCEPHAQLASLAPLPSGRGSEVAPLQSGNHLADNFHPENSFGHKSRIGNMWESQEFRQNPGLSKEHFQDPAPGNPLTLGNSPENHIHYPPVAGTGQAPLETASGTLSMFFQGEETENEENLSSEKAGSVGRLDFDGFSPSPGLGHPLRPAHVIGGVHQAFLQGSHSETTQQEGGAQPYFPQSAGIQNDKQTTNSAASDTWGDTENAGTGDASSSQYENVENLEFIQNQEVLPSEPLSLDASSSSDQFRYGPLPAPAVSRHGIVGLTRGGALNLEAPDTPVHPVRSDSMSSSYSSQSHRSLPGSARSQELVGTFIQQEVGKPEDETTGSFFKQIDSSPVGGELEEVGGSQNYYSTLSQPSTPSPPKPTGIFQTSANSSFEPVKSHSVGVKPVEADRANMVGEVRGTHEHMKKCRSVATPPDTSLGNLEQPPDNMETLFVPQACPPPLPQTGEAGHTAPPLDAVRPTLEKRPLARAQGPAKCESPATTLWAQNELADFGGNVLLAPAAPALYVPAKPQPLAVVQPPEEGLPGQQSRKPGPAHPLQSQAHVGASENLENPPKVGGNEALQSQASSSYASLLSSPPTEALQNQPVLIAQPDQSYNLAQPLNISVSLLNPAEKNQSWGDDLVGDKSTVSSWALGADPGEHTALSGVTHGAVVGLSLPNGLSQSNVPHGSGSSEMASNQPSNLLVQPLSFPVSKSSLLERQKTHNSEKVLPEFVNSPAGGTGVMLVPPASSTSMPSSTKANHSGNREEAAGGLDFTPSRTLENPARLYSPSHLEGPATQQAAANPPRQLGPGVHDPGHFYQQVREDAQDQQGLGTQAEVVAPQPQASLPQMPQAASNAESPPTGRQSQDSAQPPASSALADVGQKLLPQPPQSSSVSATSTNSSQAGARPEQPWLQPPPSSVFGPPPQDLASYYYYRPLYDAYQAQYPAPYPSDPGTASLCYQDIYGLYEPRYRPYDSSASAYTENYRYPEPERPSSRASHCSDRPPARQGYPEGYYSSKSGWSSQSDYYANYYSGQYNYGGQDTSWDIVRRASTPAWPSMDCGQLCPGGAAAPCDSAGCPHLALLLLRTALFPLNADAGRWDRYYGSQFRDPRTWDRRYWYSSEYDPPRKDSCSHGGGRPEKGDDHWRYDPRFTGSFDDDAEPHRDPYGEEVDRRSVHSEHSARSLHSTHSLPSRRSSLSSHSHQSQIYRSHNVTAESFEAPPPPGSFHGDFAYGTYGSNFSGAHGFSEYGYPVDTWPAAEQVPSRPTSPEKFSVPHLCARFGPGSQLIKVIPNLPSEGQPALVEVHSMETLLQHTAEQEELRAFPGPLGKDETHKVDVINFAQNKATKCLQDENLLDKESASLLWNFIILLCRQNGTVVGTDIAELLLRDHRTVWLPGKSPNEANLIDFTNEAVEQVEEEEESGEAQLSFLMDSQAAVTSTLEKETERFRELLLYGRKKDALESAMKNGLWGHALLLASKMDSRTHARVMTRFANSLPINDPLQTVYQLMSGRMPAASTCCGDEKWGDWRPHLAMVLSNLSNNVDVESRTMATMGDTLASKGLLDAAHFCYLMAQVGFGVYTKKTTKLVLIGSNHSLPFSKFATNEAIQRTEAYEYAQSLGAQTCCLPNFQVFKFIYCCRLAEMGLATQAFHYCEVIAKSIVTQPDIYSPVLIGQLVQVASQLCLFDPQLKEKPEEESFMEPAWLVQLQHVHSQIQEGTVPCSQDGAEPWRCPSTPGSEVEQLDGPGLGRLVGLGTEPSLLPGPEGLSPGGQLPPSALQTLPGGQPPHPARVPMFSVPLALGTQEPALGFPETPRPDPMALYPGPGLPLGAPSLQDSGPLLQARSPDPVGMAPRESPVRNSLPEPSEEDFGGNFANLGSPRMAQDLETSPAWDSAGSGPPQPALPLTPAPEAKRAAPAAWKETKEPKKSESWFSRWLPRKKRTEAYLPDDKNKSIVWDEKKNQWVNLNEPEEEKKAPPPPPTALPRALQGPPPGPGGPPAASVNVFSRKAGGSRARYVDVLNPGGAQRSELALAPANFFAPLAPLPIPPNVFVPSPDAEEPPLADGAGSRGQVPAGALANLEPVEDPKVLSSAALPPGPELPPSRLDRSQGGELSRWSSVSSLSREVGQHFQQAPIDQRAAGGPGSGATPLYSPTQASATSGSSRPGRIGQRRYPALN
ncbi:protein transport protein Sec16A isoform X4 [Heterocephalus glaber]|uniref:Protein transport protein Sec16A n=1 Tax=Heterocephalus glaber TaxID=10181 RepID=A0AAX6TA64_HETGA|nr:protein transport protein Sec16A isoform X4 [Heterocephalus glaber]